MGFGVINLLIAALNIPFPPRCNDFHFRRKVHNGQLKSHLIVALSGAAVANSIRPLCLCNFHATLSQNRAGKAGSQ